MQTRKFTHASETASTCFVDAVLLAVTIVVGRVEVVTAAVVSLVLKEHRRAGTVMATRGQNSRNQLCRIAEPGYRVSSGRKEAVFAVECFSKGRRLNNRPDAVNVL